MIHVKRKIIGVVVTFFIVKDGGDKFDVKIAAPYDTELLPEIKDNKDGTYEVKYQVCNLIFDWFDFC